ncbi:MAG: hypothetical protein ACI4O8_05730 [Aristaeellaceae bacterium]
MRVIDEGRSIAENDDLETYTGKKGSRFKNIGITNIRACIRLYCDVAMDGSIPRRRRCYSKYGNDGLGFAQK